MSEKRGQNRQMQVFRRVNPFFTATTDTAHQVPGSLRFPSKPFPLKGLPVSNRVPGGVGRSLLTSSQS